MPGTLLTSTNCASHIHLIISPSSNNPLASARANKSLSLGAKVVFISPLPAPIGDNNSDGLVMMHTGLKDKIDSGEVTWIKREWREEDLTSLGREEVGKVVDAVFVTVNVGCRREIGLATQISILCRGALRIPINVSDCPSLCSFSLLSTHIDGPLQIGVTTTGMGCKLANRIKREVVGGLPTGIGEACRKLGSLRKRIWEEDLARVGGGGGGDEKANGVAPGHGECCNGTVPNGFVKGEEADEDEGQRSTFNKLVPYTTIATTAAATNTGAASVSPEEEYELAKSRRIRWLSQVCEYWPLSKLCKLSNEDMQRVLESYTAESPESPIFPDTTSTPTPDDGTCQLTFPPPPSTLPSPTKRGTIHLLGSGPGHPSLLTTACLHTLLTADLILADKLVPAPILALIPRRTPLHIARKFPGNADRAQTELLNLALSALKLGQKVVRLKQGDPYLYGRGGEEVLFFRQHGFEPFVVPGITSSLSAALCAGIPVTHRGVADEVVICTGTGTGGINGSVPGYRKGRTVVWLMALHRLKSLVEGLIAGDSTTTGDGSPSYPSDLPCAVIERASCPDQRVIRTTLRDVVSAVEEVGSRPPGLLVVGWACGVLNKEVGGEEGKGRWVVEEGFRGFD